MPAAERTAASTGSGEATSTTEGAQDGNIKQWVGQQLEPIRTAQRDIVKSLNELLDMHGNNKDTNGQLMAKLDKLQDMPGPRLYTLFAKAGAKAACVISERGEFKGMISRKGLIETTRRYEEELAQRCYGARDVLQSGAEPGQLLKVWKSYFLSLSPLLQLILTAPTPRADRQYCKVGLAVM
eukprot:s141_g23.t1